LSQTAMDKTIYYPQFFTATIKEWKALLKPDKYKVIIIQELQSLVHDDKLILYAYCIMNNHIHLIWQFKDENQSEEIRKSFLESTAKAFKKDLTVCHPQVLVLFSSTQKDRSYHFWKRRPLSIDLFTEDVFNQKLNYIHENPIRAGICGLPEDYKYSSAGFYLNGMDPFNMLTHYKI
jgi:putative transposase